jgi:hypothetical protein
VLTRLTTTPGSAGLHDPAPGRPGAAECSLTMVILLMVIRWIGGRGGATT